MSDVEKFYAALAVRMQSQLTWWQLNPMEQVEFIKSINMILGIMTIDPKAGA